MPERDLFTAEPILQGNGLLRTATRDSRYALRVFYCSLFAIAWSISLPSAAPEGNRDHDKWMTVIEMQGYMGGEPEQGVRPHLVGAPKPAMTIELWAEKRAQLENGEIDADEYEDWKASL